jgi:hypothetical protein
MSIFCTDATKYGNVIQFNNSVVFFSGNASITNSAMALPKKKKYDTDYESEDDCEGCKWCVKHQNPNNKRKGDDHYYDNSPMKRVKKEDYQKSSKKKREREGFDEYDHSAMKRVKKEEPETTGTKRKPTAYAYDMPSNKRERVF